MPQKLIPIGIEDFRELIQENYYYVDKTLLIKELLDKKGKANLFTRPRRFGKTLNMNMLRHFFEDAGTPEKNKENQELFQGLKIMGCGENYLFHMGKHPVIQISLKSSKQPDWELSYGCLKMAIEDEYQRHMHILPRFPWKQTGSVSAGFWSGRAAAKITPHPWPTCPTY